MMQVDIGSGILSVKAPIMQPTAFNTRVACETVLSSASAHVPVFGIEQEYAIDDEQQLDSNDGVAAAWPHAHLPNPMGHYMPQGRLAHRVSLVHLCVIILLRFAVGSKPRSTTKAYSAGRRLAEKHLQACLRAGIKVTETSLHGGNGSTGVWSYKLGPLLGLDLADELWMSRFVMMRVSAEEGIGVSFVLTEAAPDDGLRCCIKYSTALTRQPTSGMCAIQMQLERLQHSHELHQLAYGKRGCKFRPAFNVAVGGRGVGIVVPAKTLLFKAGHYVDRRPASNVDPYLAIMMLVSTTLGIPLPPTVVCCPRRSYLSGHCHSSGLSSTYYSDGDSSSSSWSLSTMNSEDVLVDELDKALGDSPPKHCASLLGYASRDEDECTSPSPMSSSYH